MVLLDPVTDPLAPSPPGRLDPGLQRTQFTTDATDVPDDDPLPPDLLPLDDPPPIASPASGAPPGAQKPKTPAELAPILPGSQRVISISSRSGGPLDFKRLPPAPDGTTTFLITGGVTIVTNDEKRGTVDLSADSAIVWSTNTDLGPQGDLTQDDAQPLEVYMEGNVIFRQDKRKVAGNGDQSASRAEQAYYDFRLDRFVALNGEFDMWAPGFIAPINLKSPRIVRFQPTAAAPGTLGALGAGQTLIQADNAVMTGSRFPIPGYRFQSKSIDITETTIPLADPNTGALVGDARDPNAPQDINRLIDARQNVFFLGPVPVFYWPRLVTDADDLDPPLRNITFRSINYFGQQLLTDWNGFKLFGIRKPAPNDRLTVDNWNVDIDYLSYRGLALGTEFGYFGKELIPNVAYKHFGYIDVWGIRDYGVDNLGSGPAIVTEGGPKAGKKGTQRNAIPVTQHDRGRIMARHMQSFLSPEDVEEDPFQDFRLALEAGYISDRHFLPQYYKRLFDIGLDQETAAYLIRQKENRAWTALVEGNLQSFYTDTQWLPKLDYYRLGDAPFNGLFTYFHHSGVDYANTHTATEVNNPNIFTFLPYDPISQTSSPFTTGRIYTSHELDMPIDLEVIRFVPYLQGQLVGWNSQYQQALPNYLIQQRLAQQALIRGAQGDVLGRAWGAGGIRANVMAYKVYPGVESELLNIHGLNHKINFDVDYRTAYSTLGLNRIGVQDDLDDNTYEFVRRYFAMTNYVNSALPPQYNPLLLTSRRASSPITGTTDVQTTIETFQMGIHQRWQTKHGPEGKRRPVDYMVLDLTTTYFPNANRDNFGKPFGQNMYNYEWFVGDRTSIVSYGWGEFWNITGKTLTNNPDRHNNPFGLSVITAGVNLNRPPRGSIFIGYSIINSGVIRTSALTPSFSYQLSPKWYGTFSTSYDFGNAILLGSAFSVTRIGADFLASIGLTVNPLQQAFGINVELTPRLSPNMRIGSTSTANRFDSRFAPTQ